MKNSLRILNLVLLLCIIVSSFTGCLEDIFSPGGTTTTSPEQNLAPWVDYVSQVKLDMTSPRLRQEVTVHQYVDGDTTHFNVPTSIAATGVLKARYLAINTPESTGAIEEWGKAASAYTRSKLEAATSIIIESDNGTWNLDSTGARHLVWVWYKTAEMTDYSNLNLELLQEGLAIASNSANNSYGSYCMSAISQAKAYKLYVYSDKKDPDFYYGDAIQISLKEVSVNPEKYLGMTVACEGVVVRDDGSSIFVEEYDEETGMYFGITCFKGYNLPGAGLKIIEIGNRVKIVGSVQYYEAGGIYQISDLSYRQMKPDDPDNIQLISTGHSASYTLTTGKTFCTSKVQVLTTDAEGEEIEKELDYATAAINTTIEMHNLKVTKIYTSVNTQNSDGALTITCQTEDGYTVTIRTVVLTKGDNELVTEDEFKGKTINVKGIVSSFNGKAQIKVLDYSDFEFVD